MKQRTDRCTGGEVWVAVGVGIAVELNSEEGIYALWENMVA
jgi:hypothetical protein